MAQPSQPSATFSPLGVPHNLNFPFPFPCVSQEPMAGWFSPASARQCLGEAAAATRVPCFRVNAFCGFVSAHRKLRGYFRC